ncbi:hypothetical protein FTUN_2971 [Frigoriglobus tundricola]|uniref:Uncharacterized protein n=1 Tax=Frigoriglobus tundricola TaxID=2774151 RepID=A0A6M5YR01_9BACT|nr:hypothetical protein FTUN_2971 [Frigoriglobus tundricola]
MTYLGGIDWESLEDTEQVLKAISIALALNAIMLGDRDELRKVRQDACLRIDGTTVALPKKGGPGIKNLVFASNKSPVFIPQVYMHYGPYTQKERGEAGPLKRQRMDVLLLLRGGHRIVLEVDGRQHYWSPENGKDIAKPARYVEMVDPDAPNGLRRCACGPLLLARAVGVIPPLQRVLREREETRAVGHVAVPNQLGDAVQQTLGGACPFDHEVHRRGKATPTVVGLERSTRLHGPRWAGRGCARGCGVA